LHRAASRHRIGVGDVKVLPDQRHAERRVQVLEKHASRFSDAIAVAVAQQGDAVGARGAGAGALLHELDDPALDALPLLGPLRRIGFRDQHVAIGQNIEPARMVEIAREGGHRKPGGRGRFRSGRPALGGRDVDDGNERRFRLGQRRVGSDRGLLRQLGGLAAAVQHERQRRGAKGPDQFHDTPRS
jgi:hypothetical protein